MLNQKRLCKNLWPIILKSIDLINVKSMIKKAITSKNQYIAQRTREIYITLLFQYKALFDFSLIARMIDSRKKMRKH